MTARVSIQKSIFWAISITLSQEVVSPIKSFRYEVLQIIVVRKRLFLPQYIIYRSSGKNFTPAILNLRWLHKAQHTR